MASTLSLEHVTSHYVYGYVGAPFRFRMSITDPINANIHFTVQNIDGRIQCRWSAQRVLDMKITASGQRVVTMSYERFINIYDLDHFKLLEVG